MWFFNRFFKKKAVEKHIDELDLELKDIQKKIKLREYEIQLAELDAEYDDLLPESNPADDFMDTLMSGLLQNGLNLTKNGISQTTPPPPTAASLSDEEIDGIFKKIPPNFLSEAKFLPEEHLKTIILEKMPGLNEETIKKMIFRVKTHQ